MYLCPLVVMVRAADGGRKISVNQSNPVSSVPKYHSPKICEISEICVRYNEGLLFKSLFYASTTSAGTPRTL